MVSRTKGVQITTRPTSAIIPKRIPLLRKIMRCAPTIAGGST